MMKVSAVLMELLLVSGVTRMAVMGAAVTRFDVRLRNPALMQADTRCNVAWEMCERGSVKHTCRNAHLAVNAGRRAI